MATAKSLLTMMARLHAAIAAVAAAEAGDRASIADSAAIVARYRDILAEAVRASDPQRALQGANLSAGINKGLADAVWVGRHPEIGVAGKQVSDHALRTAAAIRAGLGMDA